MIVCLSIQCSDYEVVKMEVFVSLDGVGLSLVNGQPQEVSYITLSRWGIHLSDSPLLL